MKYLQQANSWRKKVDWRLGGVRRKKGNKEKLLNGHRASMMGRGKRGKQALEMKC